MAFELRDYQKKAVDALYDYWAQGKGENPLIVAPTGSGKTAIIAQIVRDAMSFPGTRVLIVTHVKELLTQVGCWEVDRHRRQCFPKTAARFSRRLQDGQLPCDRGREQIQCLASHRRSSSSFRTRH